MNSAQDPQSSQPEETSRIPFLLSRQLDGDLTPEESSELAGLPQTDAHRECLAAMTDLRNQLKSLPVKPVSASFATFVLDAIHQASAAVPATSTLNPHRGRIMRGIVAVSVMACGVALILFLRSQDVAPSDRTTQIVQQEELRPFLENDQWRIVVVKVHSKDPEEVMQIIKSHVAKGGMDIRSVIREDDHDARFGVLFTSTGDNDNAFIDSVISETDAQSADWNPPSVANSTSDSFIHRLQESMKSPTLSELHFGQVYMAQLKSAKPAATASRPLLAQNDGIDGARLPPAATDEAAAPSNEVATTLSVPSARKTPVLLVFEFTDTAPEHI